MASEVEDRIHKALQSHPLERTADGYRLVQPHGAGTSTLRLRPVNDAPPEEPIAAVAEIIAEYDPAGLPPFHEAGVQRLNMLSVHGAYHLKEGRLSQVAQFSIYQNEAAAHLAAQIILNAFGGQLPLGQSTALATVSTEMLEKQRAHHGIAARWPNPVPEAELEAATARLQSRGLAASHNTEAVWAELPLSGTCPSRAIDPTAETALLQVQTATPHPIAGAGYLATIYLPPLQQSGDHAKICARLNELELEENVFVPRLGAWGLHGTADLPGYSCFLPWREAVEGLHLTLLWWNVRRAAWLRDRFWVAGRGIVLDKQNS